MKNTTWADTIEKGGAVAGLVELSIVLPDAMPHYVRKG